MRIASGYDDTGFPLKEQVAAALEASGHDLLDLGTFSTDPVDHPDYARAVRQAVLRGFVDAGVLICGSGAGVVLGVNPFDEPDVTRAKENTASLLGAWKKSKKLAEWPADAEENGLVLMANSAKKPAGGKQTHGVEQLIQVLQKAIKKK